MADELCFNFSSDAVGSRQPSGSKYLTKLQLTFSESETTQVAQKEEKKICAVGGQDCFVNTACFPGKVGK